MVNCLYCGKARPKLFVSNMPFCDKDCYEDYMKSKNPNFFESLLDKHRKGARMLSSEECKAYFKSGAWKKLGYQELFEIQLIQDRQLIPFDLFWKAAVKTLGRPVYEHELIRGQEQLYREYIGLNPEPTFEQIMDLLPENNGIEVTEIIEIEDEDGEDDEDKKAYQKSPF